MKKNAFTLVEILAVLVLIGALALISIPSIINYINSSQDQISEVTEKLIIAGAETYMDSNPNLIPTGLDQQVCIQLQDIVDSNHLEGPILDSISGEEVDLNKFVKVQYIYDYELETDRHEYEIVDECTTSK